MHKLRMMLEWSRCKEIHAPKELCVKWYSMHRCVLSRSRFTPCMPMEGKLPVLGDCQCSYTGMHKRQKENLNLVGLSPSSLGRYRVQNYTAQLVIQLLWVPFNLAGINNLRDSAIQSEEIIFISRKQQRRPLSEHTGFYGNFIVSKRGGSSAELIFSYAEL